MTQKIIQKDQYVPPTAVDLGVPTATGFLKITVGTTAPSSPNTGDLWVDSN